jgi:diguanylate cyclase (GGDEF)-like protein
MQRISQEFSRQQRLQWWGVGVLLLVAGALLAYVVYRERQATLTRESERLLTQARVIDENLSQQLNGVNAALNSVREDMPLLAADGFGTGSSRRLTALSDAMPGVRTMLIANAQGKVLASNRPEVLGLDVRSRPYFPRPGSVPAPDTLIVSKPFETVLKTHSINLVKPWSMPGQPFGGIISATLDPAYFQVLLRSVLYAEDMRSTIVHGQGTAFVAMPASSVTQAIVGMDLTLPGTFLSRHRATGLAENVLIGHVAATGDERMVAYRTIQPSALHMDQPLYLAVSRDLEAVLTPWRQVTALYFASYAVVGALLVAGLLLLQRQQRTVVELTLMRERELKEYADKVDLALAGADLGLWSMEIKSGVRTVNARALEMVGNRPDDPVDDAVGWAARMHPEDQLVADHVRHVHEQGEIDAYVADYRVRHKLGHWVWIHARGKVTRRDENGEPARLDGTYLDVSERKAVDAQIAEFAFYDALTQLPNRRLLMDRLAQAQLASARSGRCAALMFLDLDRFKAVNDALGHDMGDLLLRQVALRLQTCVRQSDTVARLGGDEFVLVIHELADSPSEAPQQARRLAEKVLESLRKPIALGNAMHTVTTSIGVAVFCGEEESASLILKRADQAMYLAKNAGRDSVHVDMAAAAMLKADALAL